MAKENSEPKPTPEGVQEVLQSVPYPGFKRDIVSFGMLREISLEGCRINVILNVRSDNPQVLPVITEDITKRLKEKYPRFAVSVENKPAESVPPSRRAPHSHAGHERAHTPAPGKVLDGVKYAIAVGSGKGGVGKSTVAVNLALALKELGYKTGLMDADVFGPSLPMMTGVHEKPKMGADNRLLPVEKDGLKLMSIGFLVEDDAPVIWRGLMVMKLIEQFLDVAWGEMDFLVIDLPPGTGDTQLTLVQKARLSGAVIVTTPQDLALLDAVRAANMFRKVDVPVLGVVENMSAFACPKCGEESRIFGAGGAEREAKRLGIPLLGSIPLHMSIREGGDAGRPLVAEDKNAPAARAFLDIARKVAESARAAAEEAESPHIH